ncbi:MAG TPA: M6 family metalloprotease domain-containing protein [Paludibacteraceae bacterium]|nr:M6 family metalloprotease domain-containing protein [Paludibacteraceae bacterium]HRT78294.1 M6 family metalloprotease domain-containing protein [Paludibacteraceae bacterium]
MKNRYRSLFFAFFLALLPLSFTHAVKAYPFPVQITQPDGTVLTIRIHGDEFHHIKTTVDGYLVKQNAKGYWTYASQDAAGRITPSEVIARNVSSRSAQDIQFLKSLKISSSVSLQHVKASGRQFQKPQLSVRKNAFPLSNSPRSLVILVNFSDKSFVTSSAQSAFTNLLNQSGYSANGATGSARDYFMASSYGKFSPEFDVVGPYTLSKTMQSYGANDADGYDVDPARMIVDACKAADNAGVNFSQYDTDNDGLIDNIFVYYAGYNEAEGASENTIWPHRWVVYTSQESSTDYTYDGTVASVTFDGVRLYDYACTSELKGTSGSNMCGVGTFCHEFGHVLGLPDYYHTAEDKTTLDYWNIMDAGNYLNDGRTPPVYSTYDRFYLGWLTPEEANTPSNLTLKPIYQGTTQPANTHQQSYLLSATTHNLVGNNPSPKEFFVLEYRKKTGWDAYLPAEGMLIWHIDYDQTAWDNNEPNNYTGTAQTASSHMRVYLQPLSGSTTTPGTAFTSGSFTPTTWSGTNINRAITEISKSSDQVTFKLMGGEIEDPNKAVIKLGVIQSQLVFPYTAVNNAALKVINIKTNGITGNLTVTLSGDQAEMFSVSANSITQNAANSTDGVNLNITYRPTTSGEHTAVLTISGGGLSPDKVILLKGTGQPQ